MGADVTGWWRDPAVLAGLGPTLARLVEDERPEVVLAPQSRGTLLGALVAADLNIGLVELRKEPGVLADSDAWITARTPPDYRDRNLTLSARASLLDPGTRVLFVDDWVDTGGQLQAAHTVAASARAHWCGAAVVVDALSEPRLRHELKVRALLHIRHL
ncbi:phosphoribosyltransferase family protein [Micropruina sp.]|uniref:phosphoribosyltransferase family protein n=1 Tax=Micropruina sp. TaxID=2737536 RepID=UPI0039E60FE2